MGASPVRESGALILYEMNETGGFFALGLRQYYVCACEANVKTNLEQHDNSRLVGADGEIARQTPGNDFEVVVKRRTIEERLSTLRKCRQNEPTAAAATRHLVASRVHLQRRRVA